ncbi:glycosyltransferase family 4 protein [Streptomyces sp. TR02-1]|uniref:glycosyltransferase family 4 protein n=1 Tax=Streptomyces sp. TR02-1 TaxID=3385977 RepID=UPI0039A2D1C6
MHVLHVLGCAAPGPDHDVPSAVTCAHLRSLVAGLVAHGIRVTVHAPPRAEIACGLTEAGARVIPGGSGRRAVRSLRAALAEADLVHAHGQRAAALAALARQLRRPRAPLIVNWHPREPEPVRERALRLLERRVAAAASVVLAASTGLVDRARLCGARDVRLAPPAPAVPRRADSETEDAEHGPKLRAEIGAVDRPLLLAAGRLDARHTYRTALTAARSWRRLGPPPLLAVVGEGPERAALQAMIDTEELPVRLLGRRDDVLDLLHVADLAMLTPGDADQELFAREALWAGVPLVGTGAHEVRELAGEAGALTRPGDAEALAGTVARLLEEPAGLAEMSFVSRSRGAALPTEEHSIAHVLSVYDELLASPAA